MQLKIRERNISMRFLGRVVFSSALLFVSLIASSNAFTEIPPKGSGVNSQVNSVIHNTLSFFAVHESVITPPHVEHDVNMVRKDESLAIIDLPVLAYPDIPEIDIESVRTGYSFALKSNLLFDLVGAPNLGVEVPIGRKFSVGADFAYAYWQLKNLYALQTIQGGVEAKYWFNQKRGTLTGWNAGVYGIYCSRYDMQWKDGYQGDGFYSAGASGGYAIPVSNRFNIEFALAAGYFYTPEVRHYHKPENDHLLWQETRYNVGRFTLTKLKVNIVWLIGKEKRTK